MNTIAVWIIVFYQSIIATSLQAFGLKTQCRFSVTCSEYTKRAILRHGVFKGFLLGSRRILSCQPFF